MLFTGKREWECSGYLKVSQVSLLFCSNKHWKEVKKLLEWGVSLASILLFPLYLLLLRQSDKACTSMQCNTKFLTSFKSVSQSSNTTYCKQRPLWTSITSCDVHRPSTPSGSDSLFAEVSMIVYQGYQRTFTLPFMRCYFIYLPVDSRCYLMSTYFATHRVVSSQYIEPFPHFLPSYIEPLLLSTSPSSI